MTESGGPTVFQLYDRLHTQVITGRSFNTRFGSMSIVSYGSDLTAWLDDEGKLLYLVLFVACLV